MLGFFAVTSVLWLTYCLVEITDPLGCCLAWLGHLYVPSSEFTSSQLVFCVFSLELSFVINAFAQSCLVKDDFECFLGVEKGLELFHLLIVVLLLGLVEIKRTHFSDVGKGHGLFGIDLTDFSLSFVLCICGREITQTEMVDFEVPLVGFPPIVAQFVSIAIDFGQAERELGQALHLRGVVHLFI